jgi:hypothetical protein
MKIALKKFTAALGLSFCLSTTTPPHLAANTWDNVELVTALLRGYAAHLEVELCNDTSRSANIKRVVIAAIRLANDLSSNSPHWGWRILDGLSLATNLSLAVGISQRPQPKQAVDEKEKMLRSNEHETLRRFVLPAIEMLWALARTKAINQKLPFDSKSLAAIGITMTRLGQFFFEFPVDSSQRIFYGLLLVVYAVSFLREVFTLAKTGKLHWEDNCPICYDGYRNPVALKCGHIFCRNCILRAALERLGEGLQATCPYDRKPLDIDIVDSRAVQR